MDAEKKCNDTYQKKKKPKKAPKNVSRFRPVDKIWIDQENLL